MQPKHALTARLANLQSWRYGMTTQIARVGDFLREHGGDNYNAGVEAQIDALTQKAEAAHITVIFVAEAGRGKSELINALFFADLGRRFLPSGVLHATRCVTEVRFDRNRKTGLRLLPIESREVPRRFQDIYEDENAWRSIFFDADNPDTIARAFGTLSETRRVSVADAVSWGLHQDSLTNVSRDGGWVDVPRWRYAVINFPHPLLDAGLVVIDTPGLAALTGEPEFSRETIPAADAIIVVLDAVDGVSKTDLSIWKEQLGGARNQRDRERDDTDQARLVVLNKIDRLYFADALDPIEADRTWLREVDKRVQDVADLMRVEPIKVLPVSATQALIGAIENNQDALLKSRLYRLERALALYLPDNRQAILGNDILSELSDMLEAAQATLDEQRYAALEGLRALTELRRKNLALSESINVEVGAKRAALLLALDEIRAVKPIHSALAAELSLLTEPQLARDDAFNASRQIAGSMMPGKLTESLANYFAKSRSRISDIDKKLDDIRLVFGNLGEKIFRSLALGHHELHPFATHRFLTEIEKAEDVANTELSRAGNMMVRRPGALAEQFEASVAKRVVHVLEIAHRESATWMRGVFTGIEKPVEELHKRMADRAGKVEMIRSAELDLAEKIAEFQANIDVIKTKHAALSAVRESVERFSGKRHDDE
jgi:GTPase SAR1 family protein